MSTVKILEEALYAVKFRDKIRDKMASFRFINETDEETLDRILKDYRETHRILCAYGVSKPKFPETKSISSFISELLKVKDVLEG
jgi:hypothetical protein